MATTGFWPIKGSLKGVIEYANNPDKTIDPRFLDEDLARVVQYAENDKKTDQKMFVTGINCSKDYAYEDMKAVQKRFGLRGCNVAYHGYQSFMPNEITADVAHMVGIETAKRLWGDRYQVLVTTHLNTDSIHNHLVLNPVSYVDGKKFHNHIRDHIELREISDKLCYEFGLSVLEDAPFFGGEKKAYWIHKSGKQTHRDILKADIEECLKLASSDVHFLEMLQERGYEYDYVRHSIKAPSWERGVRLDRLGYSRDNICDRILDRYHMSDRYDYVTGGSYQPKSYRDYPLLQFERQLDFEITHSKDLEIVALDLVFYILLQLVKLVMGTPDPETRKPQPMSPELRMEAAKFDELNAMTDLLCKNKIKTVTQLEAFIAEKESQITALKKERQGFYNELRGAKSPLSEAYLKMEASDITQRIKPLRDDLKTAKNALKRAEYFAGLVRTEHDMEVQHLARERRREMERDRGWER